MNVKSKRRIPSFQFHCVQRPCEMTVSASDSASGNEVDLLRMKETTYMYVLQMCRQGENRGQRFMRCSVY